MDTCVSKNDFQQKIAFPPNVGPFPPMSVFCDEHFYGDVPLWERFNSNNCFFFFWYGKNLLTKRIERGFLFFNNEQSLVEFITHQL